MSTKNQMIPFAVAKEYIEVNYPNDPLLRTVVGSLLDALPKVDAVEVVLCKDCFADGCCSIQIDLDMGGHGYCQKGRRTDGQS